MPTSSSASQHAQTTASASRAKDFEPDEQWKANLKKQIEENMRSMVDEAKQNFERESREKPHDFRRLEDEYQEAMATIRSLAEDQYRAELGNERLQRRWASGIELEPNWMGALREQQEVIYAQIKQEQRSAVSRSPVDERGPPPPSVPDPEPRRPPPVVSPPSAPPPPPAAGPPLSSLEPQLRPMPVLPKYDLPPLPADMRPPPGSGFRRGSDSQSTPFSPDREGHPGGGSLRRPKTTTAHPRPSVPDWSATPAPILEPSDDRDQPARSPPARSWSTSERASSSASITRPLERNPQVANVSSPMPDNLNRLTAAASPPKGSTSPQVWKPAVTPEDDTGMASPKQYTSSTSSIGRRGSSASMRSIGSMGSGASVKSKNSVASMRLPTVTDTIPERAGEAEDDIAEEIQNRIRQGQQSIMMERQRQKEVEQEWLNLDNRRHRRDSKGSGTGEGEPQDYDSLRASHNSRPPSTPNDGSRSARNSRNVVILEEEPVDQTPGPQSPFEPKQRLVPGMGLPSGERLEQLARSKTMRKALGESNVYGAPPFDPELAERSAPIRKNKSISRKASLGDTREAQSSPSPLYSSPSIRSKRRPAAHDEPPEHPYYPSIPRNFQQYHQTSGLPTPPTSAGRSLRNLQSHEMEFDNYMDNDFDDHSPSVPPYRREPDYGPRPHSDSSEFEHPKRTKSKYKKNGVKPALPTLIDPNYPTGYRNAYVPHNTPHTAPISVPPRRSTRSVHPEPSQRWGPEDHAGLGLVTAPLGGGFYPEGGRLPPPQPSPYAPPRSATIARSNSKSKPNTMGTYSPPSNTAYLPPWPRKQRHYPRRPPGPNNLSTDDDDEEGEEDDEEEDSADGDYSNEDIERGILLDRSPAAARNVEVGTDEPTDEATDDDDEEESEDSSGHRVHSRASISSKDSWQRESRMQGYPYMSRAPSTTGVRPNLDIPQAEWGWDRAKNNSKGKDRAWDEVIPEADELSRKESRRMRKQAAKEERAKEEKEKELEREREERERERERLAAVERARELERQLFEQEKQRLEKERLELARLEMEHEQKAERERLQRIENERREREKKEREREQLEQERMEREKLWEREREKERQRERKEREEREEREREREREREEERKRDKEREKAAEQERQRLKRMLERVDRERAEREKEEARLRDEQERKNKETESMLRQLKDARIKAEKALALAQEAAASKELEESRVLELKRKTEEAQLLAQKAAEKQLVAERRHFEALQLQQGAKQKEAETRKKELEILRKEQELKEREDKLQMMEEKLKQQEELRKLGEELKMKEEETKRLADDLNRRKKELEERDAQLKILQNDIQSMASSVEGSVKEAAEAVVEETLESPVGVDEERQPEPEPEPEKKVKTKKEKKPKGKKKQDTGRLEKEREEKERMERERDLAKEQQERGDVETWRQTEEQENLDLRRIEDEERRKREEKERLKEESDKVKKREEEVKRMLDRRIQEEEEARKREEEQRQERERQERLKEAEARQGEEDRKLAEQLQREEYFKREQEAKHKEVERERARREEEERVRRTQQEEYRQREEDIRRRADRKRQDSADGAWPGAAFNTPYGTPPTSTPKPPPPRSASAQYSSTNGSGTPPAWTTWSSAASGNTWASSSTSSSPNKPRAGSIGSGGYQSPSSQAGNQVPMSEADWSRKQAEYTRQQQERFRQEQERLESLRHARTAGSVVSKEYLASLFEKNERMWTALQSKDVLRWADFPWPVVRKPSAPEEITTIGIESYICSPHYPDKSRTEKDRIKEYIKRWHPDRFETKLLVKVSGDDKEKVREGAGSVVRSLNDLLAKQNDTNDWIS